jgi:hypothetical protein
MTFSLGRRSLADFLSSSRSAAAFLLATNAESVSSNSVLHIHVAPPVAFRRGDPGTIIVSPYTNHMAREVYIHRSQHKVSAQFDHPCAVRSKSRCIGPETYCTEWAGEMGCRFTDTVTGLGDLAGSRIMAYVSWPWSAKRHSIDMGCCDFGRNTGWFRPWKPSR